MTGPSRLLPLLGAALLPACGPPEVPACRLLPGELVITEIQANPAGPDADREWIEVRSDALAPLDLEGLRVDVGPTEAPLDRMAAVSGLPPLGPGELLVLGDAPPGVPLPAHLDAGIGLGPLPNDGGRVVLSCGAQVVDAARYGPAAEGVAWSAGSPDALDNDTPAGFCPAATSYAPDERGSPGTDNPPCPSADAPPTCLSGGARRPVRIPAPGDLVISELMADPAAVPDAAGEWFEVRVDRDVDLVGLALGPSPDRPAHRLGGDACLPAARGTRLVFARRADAAVNGGLPRVDFPVDVTLANRDGGLALTHGEVLVDAVTWPAAPPGSALQVAPALEDARSNDPPEAWCPAEDAYGAGDRGSPGAANHPCPPSVPEDGCLERGAVRPLRPPRVGDLRLTEVMPDPDLAADATGEWLEVEVLRDVDLNGVVLALRADAPTGPLAGPACLAARAGDRVVFAAHRDAAVNGGLPWVDHALPFALPQASGTIVLLHDGRVLDAWAWPDSRPGTAWSRDPQRPAWCLAEATYGLGDRGTPGWSNPPCP